MPRIIEQNDSGTLSFIDADTGDVLQVLQAECSIKKINTTQIEFRDVTGKSHAETYTNIQATVKDGVSTPFDPITQDLQDLIDILVDDFILPPSGGSVPTGAATEAKQDELIQKTQKRGATVVRTSVVSSTSVQTLAAANANRIGLVIHNDSSERLFIAYGTGATTSDFTVRINRNSTIFIDDTTAEITAVSSGSAPTGNIFITEITP